MIPVRAVVALSLMLGCTRSEPASTASPVSATPASATNKPAGCEFWGPRAYRVTVRQSTSHGHFFRELSYDDATGVVHVHDSDIFAPGSSADAPRVIERDVTLAAAQRDALSNELIAACPTADEAEPSEPISGGQVRMEVKGTDGKTRRAVNASGKGSDAAQKTLARLSEFFPDLRKTTAGSAGPTTSASTPSTASCGGAQCTAPEECVTVSGKSGVSRKECWILCAKNPTKCPTGTKCTMIDDGPGHVCVKQK